MCIRDRTKAEDLQIKAAADMGALIFDGLCDGIFLYNHCLLYTSQLCKLTITLQLIIIDKILKAFLRFPTIY